LLDFSDLFCKNWKNTWKYEKLYSCLIPHCSSDVRSKMFWWGDLFQSCHFEDWCYQVILLNSYVSTVQLVPRPRRCGPIHPLPHTSSWHSA
jgi:hypothetical protein